MDHKLKFLLAGAMLAMAGCATVEPVAQVDPIVQRQTIMKAFGAQGATVNAQARGTAPYNPTTVRMALDVYAWGGSQLGGLFPASSQTGTAALPAIWENRADFNAKIAAFNADIAAARAVAGDETAGKAALLKITTNCGGCHATYRARPAGAPGGGAPAAARPAT